ncbi:WXG100 family type VII secretion target [Streptodolium elevatio]|uniref:WXG100 family type VII secretion target n=1 Tax=Streptodolium elevatio TaxID=3157996 RepID=A0ABV3DH49_9ACTN
MADVNIDFDEIANTAKTMGTKLSDISNELGELETTVSGLLQDGLVFEKASPALKEAYDTFSSQMKTSAANIASYAENFNQIATSLGESDTKLMNEIRSAIEKMKAEFQDSNS